MGAMIAQADEDCFDWNIFVVMREICEDDLLELGVETEMTHVYTRQLGLVSALYIQSCKTI